MEPRHKRARQTPDADEVWLHVVVQRTEMALVAASGRLHPEYFGRGSSIPFKVSEQAAMEAFRSSREGNAEEAFMITWKVSARLYQGLVEEGVLQECPWVAGWRLRADLDINDMHVRQVRV